MSSLEAKIVVLGAQGVGKTSLVNRFCKGSFSPAQTTSTVGASFLTKRVVDADSDTTVRLQIWDTAGQERFRSISRLYYRGANACILCYSITDAHSFADMGVWLAELRRNLPGDVVLHVVGTKADIVARDPARREVPFERCIAYVAENLAPGQGSTPPPTATAPAPIFASLLGPAAAAAAASTTATSTATATPAATSPHQLGGCEATTAATAATTTTTTTPGGIGAMISFPGLISSSGTTTTATTPGISFSLPSDHHHYHHHQQQHHGQQHPHQTQHHHPHAPTGPPVGPRSPSSKRSSGFWGQEAGWDACHEISAESGEGVEEVFRVVTRKLVEQSRRLQQALLAAAATPGTPWHEASGADGGGYFDGLAEGGSFRKLADLTWNPVGIILSGGPYSWYEDGAPHIDPAFLVLGVPGLGICYGMCRDNVVAVAGTAREYGHADLTAAKIGGRVDRLFEGLDQGMQVWMSHGDKLSIIPEGFHTIAMTRHSAFAAIGHESKPVYAIQVHPEVTYTVAG